MKIAFLTRQFPTEKQYTGGVGSYVLKMALALAEAGHEPEVFVTSTESADTLVYQGIRVQRVPYRRTLPDRVILRLGRSLTGRFWPLFQTGFCAWKLARALAQRQRHVVFDIVQSSNFGLTGCFVRRSGAQRHLVRISTSRILYSDDDVAPETADRLTERLDVRILKRSDVAYAPSSYLADYFRSRYDLPVQVLRPPHTFAFEHVETLPWTLPRRFLVHYGNLGRRKGSNLLAQALPLAWAREPGITMVWAGRESEQKLFDRFQYLWGERSQQVTWLGPVDRRLLYGVIKHADAAVLPSIVDNLPNTVIESLALGVPVIGSNGASIDELVDPGRNGELVPIGDVTALADAMVRTWRNEVPWLGANFQRPTIFDEMTPSEAVKRFLLLADSDATTATTPECAEHPDRRERVPERHP